MEKNNYKAWLYLLPALLFIVAFLLYPLIDVLIYSLEEDFNFVTQTYTGVGFGNFKTVISDPAFGEAMQNTFILVFVTVPLSTALALLISVGLASIKKLRNLFQTLYFLPYVTNTLAVGAVFMLLFGDTTQVAGIFAQMFGVDFIDGPYWAKMLVLSIYTIWMVLPFKILVFTTALASVREDYYNAARLDGTSRFRMFYKITLPMISPTIFYLVITGFIGAFKAYSDAVALFGEDLDGGRMNTIVGYVYNKLYADGGGYPSHAAAAAIILFVIVLAITCVNLLISKKKVHY